MAFAYRWTTDTCLSSGCLDVTLTEEEVKYLEEPYQPSKVIGNL